MKPILILLRRIRLVGAAFGILMPVASAPAAESIRLGILQEALSAADPADMGITFNVLFDKLKIGDKPATATIYRSRDEFLQAIQQKELDMIPLETFLFYEFKDLVDLVPAGCAVFDDSCTETLIVLGRHDRSQESLADYTQSKIIIDNRWTTPYASIWLDSVLQDVGLPLTETHFAKVSQADRASQAILPVFFGQQDLCVTTKRAFDIMAELNPQLARALTPIAESPPLLLFLLCFTGSLSAAEQESLLRDLSTAHEKPDAKQILTLSKVSRLQALAPDDLNTIASLYLYHQNQQSSSSSAPPADPAPEPPVVHLTAKP